ncbi:MULTISPECIES: LysR family transcriptional regulator [Staphylococcus]|uniref:LysR family transcriptional regulator n=1 Tax=Staphylococcus hsinchuensis TaxID=3051183 RepID=A0ABZ3EEZ0_9STAP|nr:MULTISPECIES: LysR family transcriptional regulator [unclassified Staphylococcus]
MNIEDLKAFKKVVELQSFTRAATELNFVQSNVTAKIKRLEDHYRTQLLYRDKKSVTPTPDGKVLLTYANQILDRINEAEQTLLGGTSAPFHFGSIETIAATVLPNVLSAFRQEKPDVQLQISTNATAQLLQQIRHRKIEGAFLSGEVNDPSLSALHLYNETLVVITAKGYGNPLESHQPHNIIVFVEGCFYRGYCENWLDYHQVQVNNYITLNTLDGILGCVQAELGFAMLPKSVLKEGYHNDFDVYELSSPFEQVPIYFVHREDVMQTPVFNQFMTTLHNYF